MITIANPNPSPAHRFTKETAPRDTERARKGNLASQKVKAEKRRTADIIATLFQMKPTELGIDVSDLPAEIRDKVTVQDLGIIRQMQKYCDGQEADTRAFSEILDRFEGKPVQTVVADVQTSTADDISLDEALSIAQTLEPEKPKSKPRSKKKVSE